MRLRENYKTSLATVLVSKDSERSLGLRQLPSERQGNSITCVFTVTAKELEDTNLSFCFGMPVPGEPNIDSFYAPLKNFMKP